MELTLSTCINRTGRSIRKNRAGLFVMLLALLVFPSIKNITAQVGGCADDVEFDLEGLNFPANLWRIEDVLNVSVYNNSDSLYIFLYGEVEELRQYGKLFEVKSENFKLPPGKTDYTNAPDLEPIEVDNLNNEFSEFAERVAIQTGSLPFGEYEICVFALDANTQECYGFGCITQFIAHPSPPELIMPVDEGIVTEDLPVFSWLPPMPDYGENTYEIEIVEILDGQTPLEAMEANFRWFIESDLDIISFQYPVGERDLIPGTRYAWRVEATMAFNQFIENVYPLITSPVRSFTYLGPGQYADNQPFMLNLISPRNRSVSEKISFFEWELTNPSAHSADKIVEDEDIYYDITIWNWPETLDGGDADLFIANRGEVPGIKPYFEDQKLSTNFYDIEEKAPDTLKNNCSYFWKVTCIRNEMIIAESEVQEFTVLADKNFMDAAESMLNAIELREYSLIYGLTEPVGAGEVISPEEPSDRESIEVNSLSYLFIVDDEPYSRFGHPVRYVLVDAETQSAEVYSANWFPTLKSSDSLWTSPGRTNVNDIDIALLTTVRGNTQPSAVPVRDASGLEAAMLDIECGNYILLIDGGDKNRSGNTVNIAAKASRETDSIQALYEKSGYKSLRFSQYWDQKNKEIKAIPVDTAARSGAVFLKNVLTGLRNHYVSKECCKSSILDFRLVIYINANAIQSSSKFRIYDQTGSGLCENVDYFEDVLKHLQKLPQCVKITLFVDACYSGVLADSRLLDTYLKRGNFEIITAADAKKTTPSGVRPPTSAQNVQMDNQKKTGPATTSSSNATVTLINSRLNSYSAIAFALNEDDVPPVSKKPAKVDAGINIDKINELARDISKELHLEYPNPQYAQIGSRDEIILRFPVVKNQAGIKEGRVSPDGSANIIADKESGEVTVFPKIKGEITVTLSYENGMEEQKSLTSKWGDKTSQ